jgi:vacuolar-type H+-ATPase subunit E/Vma4
MPLDDILEAIRQDALDDAAELRRSGHRRAETILSEGAATADRQRNEVSTASDEETADAARVIRNRARLDVDRQLRRSRETVFLSALSQIEEVLASFRDNERYPAVFAALVEECRDALPAGRTLRVDPRDLQLAEPVANRPPRLTVEGSLSTWGGVELWTEDGRRILNTLEARLEHAGPQLRQLFARLVPPITGGLA